MLISFFFGFVNSFFFLLISVISNEAFDVLKKTNEAFKNYTET